MDPQQDLGRFSSFLPSDVFTTIVVDHLSCTSSAFISSLASNSMHQRSFNVLVLLSNPAHALALLTDRRGGCFCLLQYVKLLGHPFCRRWRASDVTDVAQHTSLIDQCSTLLPFLFDVPSDAHMQLKIAQLRLAWEDGERMLAGYRKSKDDDDSMV